MSAYNNGRTPLYDGAAITWFADTAAMRTSATLPEYEAVRADEANFLDTAKLSSFIITQEHVIVG